VEGDFHRHGRKKEKKTGELLVQLPCLCGKRGEREKKGEDE